ncbi:MAG TPA: isoprenylcysteine carboxylmethyltransferase family protein [Blastocatellia bacterium]|nr:isoprenylcysteine carboxylmethyltransferase family protein [Blastocatellia bacterium]HMV82424.1 isoprenylcysteine carboxylmethyltransferase family protein [Blastocatellia bacterium]HMX28343.1 isoprenylcysteine carboxylmethyltransferase family protein [Blastocatellia bacterium]HMZ18034.1 isoprenylcysteine carboxylmethyltransferase family protein [Blastocatellia bacterium]HNG31157.1 isoprenylcysteine carboxylmethyltransferase family protein [Blastocatellia bacterium]
MNAEPETQVVKSDGRSLLQRLRVPIGFVTAILFAVFSRPSWSSLAVGVPIALCGILIRAWASGHLRKNAELAVAGPYAHTRNPLYFGSFVMAAGCAIAGGSWLIGAWLVIFFLAVYWPVMQAEATHMQALFGEAYVRWSADVPLFLPRLTPYESGQSRDFDFKQYRHHREYRALVGLGIVLFVLALKAAGLF